MIFPRFKTRKEHAAEEMKLLECAAGEIKVLEGEPTGMSLAERNENKNQLHKPSAKKGDCKLTVEDENEEIRNEISPLRDVAMFIKVTFKPYNHRSFDVTSFFDGQKQEVNVYIFVDSVEGALFYTVVFLTRLLARIVDILGF
eukprot:1349379-Amorphochlora_amoeboformis.AAC.1